MSGLQELLVEVGTEELPPKSLYRLASSLADQLLGGLVTAGVVEAHDAQPVVYASPRRIGLKISGLRARQPDTRVEKRGPPLQAAYDADGKPSKAALGFARTCGVDMDALEVLETDKGKYLLFRGTQVGQHSTDLIADLLAQSLKRLPVERWMRWGKGNHGEFVRPVHWLVVLLGSSVVPVKLYGVESGSGSRGHRFHHPQEVTIQTPGAYEETLRQARVIAGYEQRRELVRRLVREAGSEAGGTALIDEPLLDEVCSLVEWPCPVTGSFDGDFLRIPAEVLIASMRGHQKYFPLVGANGELMARFITVSNTACADMNRIRQGNERVLRARLSDAGYFWETDKTLGLAAMARMLDGVVFQARLGSLADKTRRITALASNIAEQLAEEPGVAMRAAALCKADLLSLMVGEFPELQGVMGGHYARAGGETEEVALAITEHHKPAFSGDRLPTTWCGQCLALADKLDTLVGIFAIGEIPTGEKDPFALRRAALGCLRILLEKRLDLELLPLLAAAFAGLQGEDLLPDTPERVLEFILERLRGYYDEQLFAHDEIDAVYAVRPPSLLDLDCRLRALAAFRQQEAATSLIGADRRIRNLLNKTDGVIAEVDPALLAEPAEKLLYQAMQEVRNTTLPLLRERDYLAICLALATLRKPVDQFFEQVLVMAEEPAIRHNRLALLRGLHDLVLHVADFSRLQH